MSAVRAVERLVVTGLVQGVGFRPFVYRLANELGLSGEVGNDASQVFIEVAGAATAVEEFAARLVREAPPLAQIESVVRIPSTRRLRPGFDIVDSRPSSGERTLVAPDTAVCGDCLNEMADPRNRRYRHPFITCVNCGPRFTIIRSLPYDRPNTTMAGFARCGACEREYRDPSDRRHHAQPIGCHACGPTLRFHRGDEGIGGDGALAAALEVVGRGEILAVKGLGGFHLACDATNAAAVEELRNRKHRPDKPFAVMVGDLDAARELAIVTEAEAEQLTSPARPIVLLRARPGSPLAATVAPRNPLVGLMLAYTPAHHLLFADGAPTLVMTSANVGGAPIVYRDADGGDGLEPLCDAMLTHDRPIHVPCDDSVVRVVDDRLLPIRRARGFAPIPVPLRGAARTVLAVGGELKNTFCVARAGHAWVSQHIGDMENLETLMAFEDTLTLFQSTYAVEPEVTAVDAHPGYRTAKWARATTGRRVVTVQHHHAHVAAVMAEHDLDPELDVLGLTFDGTGYGADGAIWGGEALVANASRAERRAHLAYVSLPGGDAAVRHPCRVALAHLAAAGVEWTDDLAPVAALDETSRAVLATQLSSGFACVPTSSMGRLFDAVASLVGLRQEITYEAQAAIELEIAAAESARSGFGYHFLIDGGVFDAAPVISAIVDDLRRDVPVGDIAWRFHLAVADLVVALADRFGLDTVTLSGGVFQNALLTARCMAGLRAGGFRALTNELVPPNDGGLALGQAFIAVHQKES